MKASMRLTGVRELRRTLGGISSGLPVKIQAAVEEVAEDLAADVRARVPRRSGKLARSVRASRTRQGAAVTMGGKDAPYAAWIERGGSRGRPLTPRGRYLGPAIEEAAPKVAQAVKKVVRDAVKDAR